LRVGGQSRRAVAARDDPGEGSFHRRVLGRFQRMVLETSEAATEKERGHQGMSRYCACARRRRKNMLRGCFTDMDSHSPAETSGAPSRVRRRLRQALIVVVIGIAASWLLHTRPAPAAGGDGSSGGVGSGGMGRCDHAAGAAKLLVGQEAAIYTLNNNGADIPHWLPSWASIFAAWCSLGSCLGACAAGDRPGAVRATARTAGQ